MALSPKGPPASGNKLDERKAAEQDVFMREVDDAVRQDQMLGVMQRYGLPIGLAVVAGLVALGGFLFWEHSKNQNIGEHGEKLVLALDKVEAGHLDQGDKELSALAGEAEDGSRAAALMMRAGIALEQKKTAEATKLFKQVAADATAPQPYRDLAKIRDVAINFDTMQPQQVVDQLKPLAVAGKPWFGPAGELVGMAYLKQGKNDLAGPLFAAIAKDKGTPATLRDRSRQMAGLLGVDAIDDAEIAAGGTLAAQ